MEVISPSNKRHDMYDKLALYTRAGVREYWLVDPDQRAVLVYDIEHDLYPVTYSFTEQVPVMISGGELSIDFQKITDGLDRFFEES